MTELESQSFKTIDDWLINKSPPVFSEFSRKAKDPWDGAEPFETLLIGYKGEGLGSDKKHWVDNVEAAEEKFVKLFKEWFNKKTKTLKSPRLIWRILPHQVSSESDDGNTRYAIRARVGIYD